MRRLGNILWGVVIYSIMYLTWNTCVIYGFTQGFLPRIAELVVLLIITTIAARQLRFDSWKDIVPYSICWALIAAALDAIITTPFSGWGIYYNWSLWVGYALVALLPLAAPLTRRSSHMPQTS